ncbi:hypothetical protein RYX36_017735 [Vicia faba]
MALPIFSSPSFTINKTIFPKNRSLSLAIWNFNFPIPIQCKATSEVANDHHNEAIPRRPFKFQPSIWTNEYIQSLNSEYKL